MLQSWHYFKLIHYFCRKFTINYSLTNKIFTTMEYLIDETCMRICLSNWRYQRR